MHRPEIFAEVQSKTGGKLAVELLPLSAFYEAEEMHQKYLKKNPNGYCHIRFDSLELLPKALSQNQKP